MKYTISQALNSAGYDYDEPTEANLIECYLDYADSYGLDLEETREAIRDGFLTIEMMCRALVRCK